MPLTAGDRLGSYEIVSLLGAGGMGEVYRARDPRLQRDVALKVLPDVAAADADRRERFMREALAVAALNHAHIVTIHSVEEASTTVFLTMELVEGRSLAEALPSGGLPIERVLAIGIAVADAVSAAHQKGITHRDLKPANIMLGEGEHAGRIKVLDFGLAKIEARVDVAGASMLPTGAPAHTAPMTAEGRILGTVAYMSPEQAEGKAIDGRSDLFSLGVVLYEMATGRRPFTGDTNLSILSSIIKDTPASVTDVNPALPRDLNRIIRRALAKDPERRYQSAKDLRNDLEDLKESLSAAGPMLETAAGAVASSSPSVSSATVAPPASSSDAQVLLGLARRNSSRLAIAAVVLVAGVAAVLYAMRGRDVAAPSASEEASLSGWDVTQLTTTGVADRPAISPDGKWVAYVQNDGKGDGLWLRQSTTESSRQLVAPERGVVLFGATFTPDGTAVDFVRRVAGEAGAVFAEIWRVPFLGGAPKLLISDVVSAISWAPDGRRIAFLRSQLSASISTQLIVANADGGGERELVREEGRIVWPSLGAPWRPNLPPAWSPDGQLIAVLGVDTANNEGQVVLVHSGTGSVQRVRVPNLNTPYGLSWLDAQSLVVNHSVQGGVTNQLFRVSYPAGALSRLTNDPNDYVGVSLTGDGRSLVTARRETRMDIWMGDSAGAAGAVIAERVPVFLPRLAWASDRLLYGTVAGGRHAIVRLTPGERTPEAVATEAQAPAATNDGSRIVFVSTSADAPLTLWAADAAGRRTTQLGPANLQQLAVTPDDRSVVFSSTPGGKLSILIVPIDGGTPAKLADGAGVAVSPRGDAIVYAGLPGNAESRIALIVCSLPGCTSPRTVASVELEAPFGWTPDGRGIAYASQGNLWLIPLDGGHPRQLTRFTDTRAIGSFAWSRDGKRLAVARVTVTNDIVLFRRGQQGPRAKG
jgi:serine/threonine protein kinase/Tol biopolymer transport system component